MWAGDVVIVGGGPSGAAAAVVLAGAGARVALVHDDRRRSWPGEVLPSGAARVVTDVFGHDALDDHDLCYAVNAAWEERDLSVSDSLAHPSGEGWLLDRARFDEHARSAAAGAGAAVITGHATTQRRQRVWKVMVRGRTLSAPLLIDATGRSATIARRSGAQQVAGSRLLACVAVLPGRGDPVQAMTIESVPEGWWYSAPTPAGHRVVALVSDADLVPRGDCREQWWRDSLASTEHIRRLLNGDGPDPLRPSPSLAVTRAGTGWLTSPRGDGWLAVGDAAAHFDPLSGQGLLTGIATGARAGAAIATDTVDGWAADYRSIVEDHRVMSAHYYSLVQQWPASTFWDRRSYRSRDVA